MKTILILFSTSISLIIVPNLGLGQNPYEKGKASVAKYIAGMVTKRVYNKHFTLNESPKQLSNSLLPLDHHFDYYFDIIDKGGFVLEQLKFYTDTLGNVYIDKDREWIGWEKKLHGYKMYFTSKVAYSIQQAKKIIADSLKSKNIQFQLLCNCTFKKDIPHMDYWDFSYDNIEDEKVEYCFEFRDGAFEFYQYGKFYGVLEEKSRPTNKSIIFDPMTGRSIAFYHLDSRVY